MISFLHRILCAVTFPLLLTGGGLQAMINSVRRILFILLIVPFYFLICLPIGAAWVLVSFVAWIATGDSCRWDDPFLRLRPLTMFGLLPQQNEYDDE